MAAPKEDQVLRFFYSSDLFARAMRDGFRSVGRFPGEFFLLQAICQSPSGRVTPSQVSRATGIRPPTLSPIVGRLEDQGLLVRVPSRSDRRRTYLEATPQGKEAYRQSHQSLMHYYREMASALTPEELDTLLALLQRVIQAQPPISTAKEEPSC